MAYFFFGYLFVPDLFSGDYLVKRAFEFSHVPFYTFGDEIYNIIGEVDLAIVCKN